MLSIVSQNHVPGLVWTSRVIGASKRRIKNQNEPPALRTSETSGPPRPLLPSGPPLSYLFGPRPSLFVWSVCLEIVAKKSCRRLFGVGGRFQRNENAHISCHKWNPGTMAALRVLARASRSVSAPSRVVQRASQFSLSKRVLVRELHQTPVGTSCMQPCIM